MQVRDILYERDGSVSEVAIPDVDARVRFLVHAETSGTVSRSKLPRAGNRPSRPGTSRARDRTRSSGGYRSSPDVICASTSDATHRCRGETMVRAIWKPYKYTLCFSCCDYGPQGARDIAGADSSRLCKTVAVVGLPPRSTIGHGRL